MHIQIVNFKLDGMTDDEYRKLVEEVAPAFAEAPGLISKVWLADPEANVYGGLYTWRDRRAMEEYLESPLFQALRMNPQITCITSRDFGVIEGATRITYPIDAVAA